MARNMQPLPLMDTDECEGCHGSRAVFVEREGRTKVVPCFCLCVSDTLYEAAHVFDVESAYAPSEAEALYLAEVAENITARSPRS